MEEKKISVIILVYNTKKDYLKKCLDSVINQTFRNLEIIIVNDGSDIQTSTICKQYAKKDNRINLIEQENKGESSARNIGIQVATTKWISFVDSDDWIELDMFEKLFYYIKDNEKKEVIICDCYVIYGDKKVKNAVYNKEGKLTLEDIEQIQLQNIEKGISIYYPPESNISAPWEKLYNKEFLIKNKIQFVPNTIRMADNIFNMEVFEKAKYIEHYNEYLYNYRKNSNSISYKYSKDTIKYYEKFIQEVSKYIQKYNKNDKFKEILKIKIVTSIDSYMYNYFFNKDNPQNYKEIKNEMIEVLNKPLYLEALKTVNIKYLSNYNKLIRFFAIRKNIYVLKSLRKIKSFLKKIIKKNI